MIFKFGPKTFSIPSARLPQIGLPYLKLLTAIRIPIPKALKIGGGRAALMSILVVAGGFGASFALVINGTMMYRRGLKRGRSMRYPIQR
jgi:hypothetical protein